MKLLKTLLKTFFIVEKIVEIVENFIELWKKQWKKLTPSSSTPPWDIAGAQGDSAPSQRRVACEPRELRSLRSCALAVSPRGLRRYKKLYLLYSKPPLRGGGLPSPAGRASRSLAAPPWEAIPALGGVRYTPPPIPRPWRRRFARHQSLASLVQKKRKKRKNSSVKIQSKIFSL